jgi:hypothetical protein
MLIRDEMISFTDSIRWAKTKLRKCANYGCRNHRERFGQAQDLSSFTFLNLTQAAHASAS